MEALLTGCPLICSNAYAMPEQVGDAALLIEPKDPVDIAQKIKRIWQDEGLRNELIKKGFHRSQMYGQKDFDRLLGSLISKVIRD
jgi:glycosyltransferase involved in cell wall biosynthesis